MQHLMGEFVYTIRAMTGTRGYPQRHLEHNDYYDQNNYIRGEW